MGAGRWRLVLLATTSHTYWSTAIAVALVLGLVSVASSLVRHYRIGLLPSQPPPERSVGRLARQLGLLQVAIYLVQETLERVAAGAPLQAMLPGRLLAVGVLTQLMVAAASAVLLATGGLIAETAGRALRRVPGHAADPLSPPAPRPVLAWASRLLAGGLGSRAPPGCWAAR